MKSEKLWVAGIILIILIVLDATNVFGAGTKMNVIIDNLIYQKREKVNFDYNYTGEFSNANWFNLVQENSNKYNIPASLILAIIKEESNGFIWSISSKGAIGLMQIEPYTAKWISQRKISELEIFQPKINIELGSKYLEWLIGNFRGNQKFAIAGYNAGQNNAIEYYNKNIAGVKNYVLNVQKYQAIFDEEGL